jgi:ATP adenylyltransferase
MDQQRLWAPWRLGYIKGDQQPEPPPTPAAWRDGAEPTCFLCRTAAQYADQGAADRQNVVALRGELTQVVLNRYPYSNGHLLVAPLRHVGDLAELTDAEHLELMRTLAQLETTLKDKLAAQGFNIGLNLGQVGGAGLPGHLHWHLLPRWTGDHNFITTIAGTRVIPQALEELWELLCERE